MNPTPLGQAGICVTPLTLPVGELVVIVMFAITDFVGSVTEVAVMVTLLPVGTADGAVYVLALPLFVVAGLNCPQDELPHVTVQLTCGLEELSLLTLSVIDWLEPTCREPGGVDANDTLIGGGCCVFVFPERD